MPKAIIELKVFLASPGDVSAERTRARQILQLVSEAVGETRGIHLKAIGWEDVASDLGEPQALINRYSAEADLVVVLFARRFGTPTSNAASGTLEEFTRAKEAWQRRGTPRVMLFFKDVDPASLSDPGVQLQQVLKFRRAFESDRTGLFQTFSDVEDFAVKFQKHLLHWLEQVQPPSLGTGPPLAAATPDPGAEPRQPDTVEGRIEKARQEAHGVFSPGSPVFLPRFLFGREKNLEWIAKALKTLGRSIVLYGPPASGKTSMLKMLEQREGGFYRSAGRGYTWTKIIRTILENLEPEEAGLEVWRRPGLPFRLVTPDEAAQRLYRLRRLVIVDDFDKVEHRERLHFTELIKKLSNHQAQLTLLLAGRAAAIEELIPDYEEVKPHVTEIKIPPLSPADLVRIIDLGFESLGITIEAAAREYILAHSLGVAHAVHQYCLDCVYALEERIRHGGKRELTIGLEECELAEADRPTVG